MVEVAPQSSTESVYSLKDSVQVVVVVVIVAVVVVVVVVVGPDQ